jgi:hypothetical protein
VITFARGGENVSVQPGFAQQVVQLILNGKIEKALELLANHYGVSVPRVRVGLPKRRRSKVLGCYSAADRTIYVLDSERLKDPFLVLHEFYHHLRTGMDKRHRGTEKLASKFARQFIDASSSLRVGHSFSVHYAWMDTVENRKHG